MGMPLWLLEVQKWVPMMVKRAQHGRSAEDTAFFILDELSEPTLQALAELAAQPDFEAKVAQLLPTELTQLPEWVGEFTVAMQEYLFGDDEGTADDGEPEGVGPVEGVLDLDAEARRRMALLEDAPDATKEPAPTS